MTDVIEAWLKGFEHRGRPPYPEDVEKLLALVRVYREAILAASVFPTKKVFPGKSIRAIARAADEKAKEIVKK